MDETKEYINKIKKEVDIDKIKLCLDKLEKLNVLVIGDLIIDQYIFVIPKGRAIKDPIMSTEFVSQESYAGGILAIANHVSSFVNKVKLVSLIGTQGPKLSLIKKKLAKNIDQKIFTRKNSPTTVKKRYIDAYKNIKLFKIEYMKDSPIPLELSRKVVDYLDKELPKYDVVIVGDFGHGFLNANIKRKLEEKSKFLAINVQTNSANMGYNYFSSYKRSDFITMSEEEIRLPLQKRFENIEDVVKETFNKFGHENFMVTLGKKGSLFTNNGRIFKAPILIKSAIDTVGAGDALFSISSLLISSNIQSNLLPFFANCAGGIAANIVGNKEYITRDKLLNFAHDILK